MSDWNIGSAFLVLGALYFYYADGLPVWATLLLCTIGLSSWGWIVYSSERKRIIRAQARYWEARATREEKKAAAS